MKIISRFIITFIVLLFALGCKAGSNCPEHWITQVISETALVKASSIELVNFDFTNIWQDDRIEYLGYIGNDYQRLHICIDSVRKISPTEYVVSGYSKVKTNRCDFNGTIEIRTLYERVEFDLGVDNWMAGKVKKQGLVVANFHLSENRMQSGSGFFNGSLVTKWYIDSLDRLLYDDIEADSDNYSNNQFLGQWTSYRTNVNKPCAWGHYRIPCSGDLDIGASEFSVNSIYLDKGWRNDEFDTSEATVKVAVGEEWFGNYSISIDYGRLDEFSEMSIDYDVEISTDGCTFSGLGYKTYFTDRCRAEEHENELRLFFIESLDGDGFADHSGMGLIATIFKDGAQYYIKSPIIADMNWDYDIMLPLKIKTIIVNK